MSSSPTFGRIIHCSDLILRIDNPKEEINNVTEWLLTSTDFRPAYPETCTIRQEVGTMGKLTVIFMVWVSLVVLTLFYCYCCEQRLFPRQKLLDWGGHKGRFGSSPLCFRRRHRSGSGSRWYGFGKRPSLDSRRQLLSSDYGSPTLNNDHPYSEYADHISPPASGGSMIPQGQSSPIRLNPLNHAGHKTPATLTTLTTIRVIHMSVT